MCEPCYLNEAIAADVHLRLEAVAIVQMCADALDHVLQLNVFHDVAVEQVDVCLVVGQIDAQIVVDERFETLR